MHPTSVLPSNELTLRFSGGTPVIYCDKCQHYCVYERVSKTCITGTDGGTVFLLFPGIYA